MTQTTSPVQIAAADLRRGDVVLTVTGARWFAAFDLSTVTLDNGREGVRVWVAVQDEEAGMPRSLDLDAEQVLTIAGPEDLPTTPAAQAKVAPEGRPFTVAGVIGNAAHVIDAYAAAPGVVRVILLNEDHARAAAAVLLQSGYLVTRRAQVLTVTPDDPYFD